MLHFFPTPYPDELWYSILCRYHTRTGNPKFNTTTEELFGGKPRSAIGSFFPNNSIYDVVSRLPEGLFDMKEFILKHTLFLFYLRMAPIMRKEKMLTDLCAGKGETVSWIWSSENKADAKLKYCPVCRSEDMAVYGETYWRTNHQIPLMTACPRHGCRLAEISIGRRSKLSERFYTTNEYCVGTQADYALKSYELPLAKTLDAYYRLPMSAGPTEGYSNLALDLSNKGYTAILRKYNITLDRQAIYREMCSFYGAEMVEQVFGDEAAAFIMTRICTWSLLAPERYAFLAVLAGQTPDVTFGQRIADTLEEQLRALSLHPHIYPKKYVAQQLKVKTHQVDAVCRRYGIGPFWSDQRKKGNDGDGARTVVVKTYVTVQEKSEIESFLKRKNMANTSDFLRFCIQEIMAGG